MNEDFVRHLIFTHWEVHWAKRRFELLQSLIELDPNSDEAVELKKRRQIVHPAPVDLSGACKLAAQLALLAFKLDGDVISNQQHTFVEMSSGEIYDFNRNCFDVNDMIIHGDRPHRLTRNYSARERAVQGRNSWNKMIAVIMADLQLKAATAKLERHTGQALTCLPGWAQLPAKPLHRFKQYGIITTEI